MSPLTLVFLDTNIRATKDRIASLTPRSATIKEQQGMLEALAEAERFLTDLEACQKFLASGPGSHKVLITVTPRDLDGREVEVAVKATTTPLSAFVVYNVPAPSPIVVDECGAVATDVQFNEAVADEVAHLIQSGKVNVVDLVSSLNRK